MPSVILFWTLSCILYYLSKGKDALGLSKILGFILFTYNSILPHPLLLMWTVLIQVSLEGLHDSTVYMFTQFRMSQLS